MDYLFRVVVRGLWLVVGLVLGGYAALANAETISATMGSEPATPYWQIGQGQYTTGAAACAAAMASTGTTSYTVVQADAVKLKCLFNGWVDYETPTLFKCVNGGTLAVGHVCNNVPQCPDSSWSLVGSQCTRPDCTAGQVRNPTTGVCEGCPSDQELVGGVCVAKCIGDQSRGTDGVCKCTAGSAGLLNYQYGNGGAVDGSGGGVGCKNGCVMKIGTGVCPLGTVGAFVPSMVVTCWAYGNRTGETCGSNTSNTLPPVNVTLKPKESMPPADTSGTNKDGTLPDPLNTKENAEDPVKCGQAGGAWGTFNGTAKCLMPDSANPVMKVETATTTKTNPDNTTTTTTKKTETTNSGPGSDQTVKSTTTTTNKDANGNTTGTQTGSSQGSKSSFCEENPNSAICKSSSFGGACQQGFVCSGDAVQCAAAKGVWEHRCQMKWAETENELSALAKEAATAKGPDEDKALNKDGAQDIDLWAKFQENNHQYLSFTKNCPAQAEFSYSGKTYHFDLSALCQIGLLMSILMRIGAYMILLRMFMRLSTS